MYSQGLIPPVFSISISRDSSHGSYIALGGIPPAVSTYGSWATTSVEYLQVSSLQETFPAAQYQFYAITPDAYLYRNTTLEIDHWLPFQASDNTTSANQTILDTGTTLVHLPSSIAYFLASLYIPPATWSADEGVFLISCQAAAPSFAVQIGGVIFPVDKLVYNQGYKGNKD